MLVQGLRRPAPDRYRTNPEGKIPSCALCTRNGPSLVLFGVMAAGWVKVLTHWTYFMFRRVRFRGMKLPCIRCGYQVTLGTEMP